MPTVWKGKWWALVTVSRAQAVRICGYCEQVGGGAARAGPAFEDSVKASADLIMSSASACACVRVCQCRCLSTVSAVYDCNGIVPLCSEAVRNYVLLPLFLTQQRKPAAAVSMRPPPPRLSTLRATQIDGDPANDLGPNIRRFLPSKLGNNTGSLGQPRRPQSAGSFQPHFLSGKFVTRASLH